MAQALDQSCGGKLTFISTATVTQPDIDRFGGEIWPGKKLYLAARGKRFFFAELKLRRSILSLLRRIQKEYPNERLVIFLENSPFAGATACARLKNAENISCYSITIDTPFAGTFQGKGIRGRINSWMFMQGRKALKQFDGLISFTEAVKKDLQTDIPFCPFSIGCWEEDIPHGLPSPTAEKTVVYAGTLIYYNGIRELLDAFSLLGSEYQLHIYGYGPMEEDVRKAERECDNIFFHGRFDASDTKRILGQYQLLINPRRIDPEIENFTFPSKMVDYILTGKSVLTSDFKTLPDEYRDFAYVLEDLQPETIAEGVRRVFHESAAERQRRGEAGLTYIREHQTYNRIAEKLIRFTQM